MKQIYRWISSLLAVAVVLALAILPGLGNIASAADTIAGIDVVGVENGTKTTDSNGNPIITASHKNSTTTELTNTELTLTGSDDLADATGILSFTVSYTLVGPSKMGGTDGTAKVSTSCGYESSFTGSTLGGSSTSGSTTVTIDNWKTGSEWSITMYASAAYRKYSGYSESSVSVTISNIVFAEYVSESFTFVGANVPYTVTYYASGTDTTTSSATIETTVIGQEVAADTQKGISFASNTSGYYLAGVTAQRGGSTVNLDITGGMVYPEVDDILTPFFVTDQDGDGNAPFAVGSGSYWSWESAVNAAVSTGNIIVLNDDYTLPTTLADNGLSAAGTYVTGSDGNLTYKLPSGVKFLVPYGSGDDGSFESAPTDINNYNQSQASSAYDAQKAGTGLAHSVYRTLTVPSGTAIDCYGSINVNGQRQYEGQPFTGVSMGSYGKIILGAESTTTAPDENNLTTQLTVRSGGTLYCYGFITGFGMVDVKNGGATHELLQVCDWMGGGNAYDWNSNRDKENFLLSQIYAQNIEAPVKFEYGATGYVTYTLTANSETVTGSTAFINTGSDSTGMVLMTASGASVLRIYDQVLDRVNYHTYGSCSMGYISVSYKYGGFLPITMSSNDYILCLSGNYSFIAESGSTFTMAKKVALLPGAELLVKEGGTLNLTGELYLWDVADWSGSYFFNRANSYSVPNDGYTRTYTGSENINCCPLPYVATLNSAAPRCTENGVVRVTESSTQFYYVDPEWVSSSASLTVNGTLNVSGVLATTTGASSNNYVKGTGIINLTGTGTGNLTAGYDGTITAITTANARAYLAGKNDVQNLSTAGNYYGLSNGYWYQWKVTGDNITITSAHKLNDTTGVSATGGSVTFTVPAGYKAEANSGDLTAADDGVTYTLSNITEDTAITVSATCAHANTETLSAVDPTCTATGLTAGTKCSDCGEVLVAQTEVAKLECADTDSDHICNNGCGVKLTECSGGTATCSKKAVCTTCNQEYGNLAAHSHTSSVTTAATCTTDGVRTYSCSACGDSYTEAIPATGHQNTTTTTVDASCTTAGSVTEVCNDCGETVSSERIEANGHTAGTVVVENEIAATCTTAGSYDNVTYCTVCGTETSRNTVAVATLGHNYESVVTAPTCTEGGYTTYTCAICGDSYVADEVTALGHSYTSEVTKEPTCTEKGVKTYTCTTCGDTYTEEIEALGHVDIKNTSGNETPDYFCDNCKLIMYYATNVRLGNSLDMMFAFPRSVFGDYPDDYYIKIVQTYSDGRDPREVKLSYANNTWNVTENYIYVTYTGVAAKEMCDKIEVTVYNSQNQAVSVTWVDSIRDYAMRLLEDTETEAANSETGAERLKELGYLKTVIVDMLNYGAACQEHFNYNNGSKENLANALLNDTQKGYATPEMNKVSDPDSAEREKITYWYGNNLIANSNSQFVVGLTANFTADMTLKYTFTNHWGKTVTREVSVNDMSTVYDADGTTVLYHYYSLPDLRIADARIDITFEILDASGNIVKINNDGSTTELTWKDSIARYVARKMTEPNDVYCALMKFADSAWEYLHKEELTVS